MSYRKEYVYVEIHSAAQRQWKRVRIDQVNEKLMVPSKNYQCFKTVQRYAKSEGDKNEKFWMPLFFDFDSKDDLSKTVEDIKRLHNYLTQILGIDSHYIRLYFSGSKGFHLIVEPECLGIIPSNDLHLKIKKATMHLAELLELSTFDPVVYSVKRVLRMPNSMHEKTKLFKIEVSLAEVAKGIDIIKVMAAQPRSGMPPEETEDVPTYEDAAAFWQRMVGEYEEAKELSNLQPDHKITGFGDLPVCMKHLLQLSALPKANTGNRTILSMATYLKDAGKPEAEAIALLLPWARTLTNIGGRGDKEFDSWITATIRYVYHRGADSKEDSYQFACKYIIGLSTADHKIPCQGVQCPAIKGKLQETKETIELELPEFSKASYLGEKVRIPVLVSGKAGTPYVVPRQVKVTCTPDKDAGFCDGCPTARFNGEASFTFDARDPQVLEIVQCSNRDQMASIKRKWRVPQNCSRAHVKVEQNMNVEEVRLSPAAVDMTRLEQTDYVVRRGFFLGYPLQPNKRYRLTGYPVKDPKTQTSSFLFEETSLLATDIESFAMTPALMEELKVFQVGEQQGVDAKMFEIHKDLGANVYRLVGREQMAIAVDLIAHTVKGFAFRNEPFVKGWGEIIVVGDSGCGKSSLVERLVHRHYGVGEMLDGASSKRTGLLYSYQESGKAWILVWGVYPLNDLGLCTIDEFGDMNEEQFALMTDARSKGIVKATGIINAETFARVRLIALTNPKKGKHLAEFDYPVTSLKELVPAAADIRRFDIACAVASEEVKAEEINAIARDPVPHVYTKHLCSTLMKWVWSRRPEDVVFTEGASTLVLEVANMMARDFYAGEIPLVEPADHRFKIARLSAACAARVFSTDEEGKKLIVKEEHVEFVRDIYYLIYTNPNFRYYDWSKERRKTDVGGDADLERCWTTIAAMPQWMKIIGILTLPGFMEYREIEALLNDRGKAQTILYVLQSIGLIQKRGGKYEKTARGLQLSKWAYDKRKVTREQVQGEMMMGWAPGGAPFMGQETG